MGGGTQTPDVWGTAEAWPKSPQMATSHPPRQGSQLPRARGFLDEHINPNQEEELVKEASESLCGGQAAGKEASQLPLGTGRPGLHVCVWGVTVA